MVFGVFGVASAVVCSGPVSPPSGREPAVVEPDPPATSPGERPPGEPEPDERSPDEPTFTIATYNVRADQAGDPDTLAAMAELDADVVVLQEVSRGWARSLRDWADGRYEHVALSPYREPWGGLAVLSRYRLEGAELLLPDGAGFPAWRAVLESPLGPVQVVVVHLYPPIRLHRRLGWLGAYQESQRRHVSELEGYDRRMDASVPTVMAGDFNEDISGAGMTWLTGRGYAPAVAGVEPTWRWTTRLGTVKWQLDHIMVRGPLRAISGRVVRAGNSDHWPVVAELGARR